MKAGISFFPHFPGILSESIFQNIRDHVVRPVRPKQNLEFYVRVSGWKKWQVIGEGPRRGAWLQVFGQIFWEEKTIEKPHMAGCWRLGIGLEVVKLSFFSDSFWGRAMGWISWHQAVTLTQFFGGFTDHSALALAVLPWGNLLIPNHLAWLSSPFTLGWWQYLASPASKRLHLSRTSTIFLRQKFQPLEIYSTEEAPFLPQGQWTWMIGMQWLCLVTSVFGEGWNPRIP